MITETSSPPEIEQHTIGQSIGLHLLPGILVGAFYYVIAQPIKSLGYPSMAALLVAAIVILIPFELGFLLYQGKKKNGALSLEGIVLYRQRIPLWQYLFWVPVIFILVGLIFTSLTTVSNFFESWFTWLPEYDMGLGGAYSKSVLINTYLLSFIFLVLIAPTVEELYFRGYLLPRMPRLKGWSPILHSTLFALYHTWTPWMVITRTIGLLPLIYIVQRKKNIYLGIIIHWLANAIDIVVGIAFIFSLSA